MNQGLETIACSLVSSKPGNVELLQLEAWVLQIVISLQELIILLGKMEFRSSYYFGAALFAAGLGLYRPLEVTDCSRFKE